MGCCQSSNNAGLEIGRDEASLLGNNIRDKNEFQTFLVEKPKLKDTSSNILKNLEYSNNSSFKTKESSFNTN